MIITTDKYHKLVITLQTDIDATFTMTYKKVDSTLITNVENATYTTHNAIVGEEDGLITFTIPFSEHNEGDVLKDFVVGVSATNISDLGVSILVDGVITDVIGATANNTPMTDENDEYIKVNPVTTQYFALNLTDTDVHTIQAVYGGGKDLGVSFSNELSVSAQQDTNTDTGNYLLEIINLPKSMTYMADIKWIFRLTKGGVGVNSKTIEVDMPHGAVWSHQTTSDDDFQGEQTDSDGYITVKKPSFTGTDGATNLANYRKWKVGTYTIQARFYDYDQEPIVTVCKVSQKITIKKGNPNIKFKGASKKGKQAQFKLVDPQGQNLPNKKLTININGKPYNKTTNSSGNVWITINKKGYQKYKVTFAGDKNMNKVTKTFTETTT